MLNNLNNIIIFTYEKTFTSCFTTACSRWSKRS